MALGMAAFGAVSCLVGGSVLEPVVRTSFSTGVAIATANALCALLLAQVGARRPSMKAFFGAIFGGMVLRMASTLGGLLIGAKLFSLPAVPLAAALLTYTALFTAVEVGQWSRQDFSPRVQLS